ncbi:MAG TPA: DUF72 domain-containing protein [Nitrososphaerales archaeon]|nr:DUF72 domain-containing protein [Nitrososphaerales archaeon]
MDSQSFDKKEEQANSEKILLGTSGWSYKEWEKIFYPDSKTPKLSYYSGVFSTAEIDSTFYAYPNKGLSFGWARNTPSDFQFSAKIPKLITHDKKLDLSEGVEVDLQKFLEILSPLKDSKKLGPLLIQLPPSFAHKDVGLLENFLEILPEDHMFAVEFRNLSWLEDTENLYSLLRKHNVANTIVDEPLLPVDLTVTANFAFIRWHGKGRRVWYNYEYSEDELDPWVDRVEKVSGQVKKVYGYFNNHFHGSAVLNSLEMLMKLGRANSKQEEILGEIERKKSGEQADEKFSDETQMRFS